MIAPWQIKRIHVLCANIGFDTRPNGKDRDEYESMLAQNCNGKTTSKDLDYHEANDLISKLTDLAIDMGVWKRLPRHPEREPEYASYKQMGMIKGLWDDVSYTEDPEKRRQALDKFMLKRFKVDLDHLYRSQVGKVIKTLQAMKNGKQKKEVEK